MTGSWSLSVVVPTYGSGRRLWFGLGEMLRWRHPAVHRLQVVVVDDGSPQCGFVEGSLRIDDVELVFLVNPVNRGQSASCLRGLEYGDADWTAWLEDDLLGWGSIATAMADQFAADVDLVTIARDARRQQQTPLRRGVQPLVRLLFRLAGGGELRDPTSPLKAVRRAAVAAVTIEGWGDMLAEGLVLASDRVVEVVPAAIGWDGRPSSYRRGDRMRLATRLGSRLLMRALTRGPQRSGAGR